MKFRERIRELDPELETPAGYHRYGHIMILRSFDDLSPKLGELALELYPWCRSVYQHQTTHGESRVPVLNLLAGEDNPHVIHKENGVLFDLDLSRITFSGGNRRLRERLVKVIQPGEFLIDMFAAVGNLSLQPTVHLEIETLFIEQNPYTFQHLQSSLALNNIDQQKAINLDCRLFRGKGLADRIFLGYHEIDPSHLKTAITLSKSNAILHLHPIISTRYRKEDLHQYEQMISKFPVTIENSSHQKVKDYAPNLEHHELILQISK